jgi:protein-L-isoaspartate(D-aspartate) O-methyltransferase
MDWQSNEKMIRDQLIARGIHSSAVLDAFHAVPRELFVPREMQASAYEDSPLPLARSQTISQPFIVALMTELLDLSGQESVLEIGTGSGYQTAILARLARVIYSAEVEPELADTARQRLEWLDVKNVELRVGNGVEIFRDRAPFDRILSAAAPAEIPDALLDQLAEGGRCVIPAGAFDLQHLWVIERRDGKLSRSRLEAVRFVPLREHA